ncbi:MAG: Catabolite control protein A [Lentisphaerae bacterium ADurb.Bin242]|nr:MAG: Catabolite control protein A [Lentisphaerae bacterium ADurb.Bin242]
MNIAPDISKKDQIAQYLRGRIRNNIYPAGKRLESVRSLADDFDVSLKIVTDALSDLEKEGLVRREAGRGVFAEQGRKLLFVFIGGDIEAPYHYYSPGVEERAKERRIKVERLPLAFIRSNAGCNLAQQFKRDYFGIIFDGYYMRGDEPEVNFFQETGLPVVLPHALTGDNETTPFMVIHPDFKQAFSDGVRCLYEKGHRRIATLTFDVDDAFRGYTKEEYLAFLEGLGCETPEAFLVQTKYGENEIARGISRLLKKAKKPTALMCVSDFFAMYAMKTMCRLGIRIPEEISVMGFCGYPGGEALEPPLSSVDMHYHDAGRLAVDTVCQPDSWFGKDASKRVIVTSHTIIERKSIKTLKRKD